MKPDFLQPLADFGIAEMDSFRWAGLSFVGTTVKRDFHPGYLREQSYVAQAIPDRRLEFATGRWCVRKAMENLGVPPEEIPAGKNRAPVWPDGLTGSISHTSGYVCGVVALAARGVGVDVESLSRVLGDSVWESVSVPEERFFPMQDFPGGSAAYRHFIFSAKEAFFKMAHARCREYFDFDSVSIRWTLGETGFTAVLLKSICPELLIGMEWAGEFRIHGGLVLTLIADFGD